MPLTGEQIDEIEAGCEGVTEGPYRQAFCGPVFGKGSNVERIDAAFNELPVAMKALRVDALHFSRLDPATVRELCRLAKIGKQYEHIDQQRAEKFAKYTLSKTAFVLTHPRANYELFRSTLQQLNDEAGKAIP